MLSSRCLQETFNILSCLEVSRHSIKGDESKVGAGEVPFLRIFFFFFLLVSDPGALGTRERTPSIYCGGPCVGTIEAATHSVGGRGSPRHFWPLSVGRGSSLIPLNHLSASLRSSRSSEPQTIARSLFIRHFEGQSGPHLPLKGPPPRF